MISFANHFLVATPVIESDSPYAQSVAYVCEHTNKGALALVINRPLDFNLETLFNRAGIEFDQNHTMPPVGVYLGGPVQLNRGFVLHSQANASFHDSLAVSDSLTLTTSPDILKAIGRGEAPQQMLVSVGCSGWGAGQLEAELASNAWLVVPANNDILFEIPPGERWEAAMAKLGVRGQQLSLVAGQA